MEGSGPVYGILQLLASVVVLLRKSRRSLMLLAVGGASRSGPPSVQCVHSVAPPAIKQKLRLNDFFPPPKAAVTGCCLLDLTPPAAFALF